MSANQWDTPENEWDAGGDDATEWGAGDEGETTEWGEPETDEPTGWDAAEPDSPADQWAGVNEPEPDVTWGGEQPAHEDWRTAAGLIDDDEDDYESGAQKSMIGKIVGLSVGALLVVVGGVFAMSFLFGGDDEDDTPTADDEQQEETEEIPAEEEEAEEDLGELEQFTPFADQLSEALSNRDAELYYELFSEDSQEAHDIEVAETAVENLPSGATYEVEIVDGSVAGDTAALQLVLHRTSAGSSSERSMTTELVREGEEWRMVVATDSQ